MQFTRILVAFALVLTASFAQAQITLGQAQAEAEAWITPRLPDPTTDFSDCVAAKSLAECHPTWSATTLPNTDPGDSALATVTNDDPGVFAPNVCDPNCYDDTRETWALAEVDVPGTSPVQLRTNSFSGLGGTGIQVAMRIQYDGVIWEKGYGLFGIAPDSDWAQIGP